MGLKEYFDKIEATPRFKWLFRCFAGASLGMILGGFIWHLFDKNHDTLIVAGFGLLAMALYFKAFDSVDEQEDTSEPPTLLTSKGFALFSQKLFWWGASVLTVGILFLISHWPGYDVLLIVGIGTFVVGLVLKILSANARHRRLF